MNRHPRSFFDDFKQVNKGLPIYRIVFVLYIIITVLPRYLWIDNYPDTFFLPRVGVTLFFTEFPDQVFFYLLNFGLITSLISLFVGYKTIYASLGVAFLLFTGNAWEYSFGKVNHDILILLIPLLLASSNWGSTLSTKTNLSKTRVWPIATFALLTALAMLSAAIPKILSGWLDPSSSPLTGHLVRNYFVVGRETMLGTYLLNDHNFFVLKFLEYSTVFIESAFILTLFSLRYFRLTCALACLFHFGVQLTMGIAFTTNIIAYAMFVNWHYLNQYTAVTTLFKKLDHLFVKAGAVHILGISTLIFTCYVLLGNPFTFDLGLSTWLGANIINSLLMLTAVAVSLYYIFNLLIKKQLFQLQN